MLALSAKFTPSMENAGTSSHMSGLDKAPSVSRTQMTGRKQNVGPDVRVGAAKNPGPKTKSRGVGSSAEGLSSAKRNPPKSREVGHGTDKSVKRNPTGDAQRQGKDFPKRPPKHPGEGWHKVSHASRSVLIKKLAEADMRVRRLEKLVSELQRNVRQLDVPRSIGKSEGCTPKKKTTASGGGARKLSRASQQSSSSNLRIEQCANGKKNQHAQNAWKEKSSKRIKGHTSSQAEVSTTSTESTATVVNDVSLVTASGVVSSSSQTVAPVMGTTQTETIVPTLDRPMYGGKSYRDAVVEVKGNKEVTFKPEAILVDGSKLTLSKRRLARRIKDFDVDSELLGYLLVQFAFVPRTGTALRSMVVKAESYLRKFDLCGLTSLEVYHIIMRGVCAAMDIPEDEQTIRQVLKDEARNDERVKQTECVENNNAGRTFGLTGWTTHFLDGGKKVKEDKKKKH